MKILLSLFSFMLLAHFLGGCTSSSPIQVNVFCDYASYMEGLGFLNISQIEIGQVFRADTVNKTITPFASITRGDTENSKSSDMKIKIKNLDKYTLVSKTDLDSSIRLQLKNAIKESYEIKLINCYSISMEDPIVELNNHFNALGEGIYALANFVFYAESLELNLHNKKIDKLGFEIREIGELTFQITHDMKCLSEIVSRSNKPSDLSAVSFKLLWFNVDKNGNIKSIESKKIPQVTEYKQL